MPFDDGEAAAIAFIETTAIRIEQGVGDILERWAAIPAEERAAVLARLERSAPLIVRLLCPCYGRFGGAANGG